MHQKTEGDFMSYTINHKQKQFNKVASTLLLSLLS